jgi:hypothetical protein
MRGMPQGHVAGGPPSRPSWAPPDATWSAGRVVTLVVALARELDRMHREGRGYGVVDLPAVRLTVAGMPCLAGREGLPRTDSPSPGSDVRTLALLGLRLLDRASPGSVAVAAGLEAAAGGRLDAAGLAERLVGATRAEALLWAPRPGATSHRAPRRNRGSAGRLGRRSAPPNRVGRTPGSRRGVVALLVALLGVGAFVVTAALSRTPGEVSMPSRALADIGSAPTAAPVDAKRRVDWTAVVSRLTAARTAAITSGGTSLLDRVYVPGAAAADADASLLRRWRAQHRRVVGLETAVLVVEPVRVRTDRAVLDVTTQLSAYRLVDASGRAVGRGRAQTQTARLSVVRRGGRWFVRTVRPVAAGARRAGQTSAASAASTSS